MTNRTLVSSAQYHPANQSKPNLEILTALGSAKLQTLYTQSGAPSLNALNGSHAGRMLALARMNWSPALKATRWFATSPLMRWHGKVFEVSSAASGTGFNRLRSPYPATSWAFRARACESVVDGKPCIALDYDLPENSTGIRLAYDEVREVQDGLYLGRAMLRIGLGRPRLLLWFCFVPDCPVAAAD